MLAMVPYLRSNIGVPVNEVAETFGVSVAQVTKDLSLLMMTGVGEYHGELIDIDLGALDDDGVVFLRDADFMPRPLALNAREASALIVALRSLRDAATEDQLEALDGALSKLEGAVGALAPVSVHLPAVEPAIKDAVLSAYSRQEQLELVYTTEARDEQTRRRVDPWKVFTARGQLYLNGWCHLAADVRTFRLDRIIEARPTGAAAEPRQAPAAQIAETLFQPGPDTPFAVLDLTDDARWMVDEYDADVIGEGAGGLTRVRLYGSDLSWLRRLVLRHGGAVRVVEPQELAEDVTAHARAALAAYDGDQAIKEQHVKGNRRH